MTEVLLKLNTGATIPALGLGTWQAEPGQVQAAVAHAIKVGYRHIDCAYVYGNEDEVGRGIQEGLEATGLKRSDLFVTGKVWCSYETRVEESLNKSLHSLQLEYIDLYLMHWPVAMNPYGNDDKEPTLPDGSPDVLKDRSHIDTYKDLEKLMQTNKVKAIGVSNYSKKYLDELLPQVTVMPAVNQIENHPLLPQQEIVDMCKEKGILITAYSPLGSAGSPLLTDDNVVKVAEETGVSTGCVLLSYHLGRGSAVLAKSIKPARIEENMNLVSLNQLQMEHLDAISKKGVHRFVYSMHGIDLGFPDHPS